MKKLISLTLVLIMCFSAFSAVAFAAEDPTREIASIELHKVKYYEAVYNESQIRSAALYVNFLVYFKDGSTAKYDSKDGWSDKTITADVSWYIKPENDENYGAQQSLYVTIGGVDYWAGYTHVEVNKFKAFMRNVITWDWMTCEEKVQGFNLLMRLLKLVFVYLRDFVGGSDAYAVLYKVAEFFENMSSDLLASQTTTAAA